MAHKNKESKPEEKQEHEKVQGAKGGQMKEHTTGGTVSQGPTVGKGGASAKKGRAYKKQDQEKESGD